MGAKRPYIMTRKIWSDLALTVKYNVNHLTTDQLSDIYKYVFAYYKLNLNVKVKAAVFELDSKNKLHVHAHISAPKDILYKEYHVKTFMVYVKPMSNQNGWYTYMYKSPYQILSSADLQVRTKVQHTDTTSLLEFITSNYTPDEPSEATT